MARKMKDSGVAWIGEIPEDWAISKVSYFYDVTLGKMIQPVQQSETDTLEYYLCAANVGGNKLKLNEVKQMWFSEWEKESLAIKEGDLLVVEGGDVASCAIATEEAKGFLFQNALHRVRAHSYNDIRFLKYYLWMTKAEGQIDLLCNKATIAHFSKEKFLALQFLAIPYDEQKNISDFLDRKCAEIDSVMEETRKTIEEYKALKQSLITRAVTRGIRSSRPMKPSGIEWIGDIPEDWDVSRIKYVAIVQPTCDHSKLKEDSDITYTPMECIKNGYYIQNTAQYGKIAPSLTPYAEGDIVVAKVTPCFENGNIAIMKDLVSGLGMGSSELFVYRAVSINPSFLAYWLQNTLFKEQGCSTMTGTGGLKRVSPYFAKNSPILIPPENEQQKISDYLDMACAEIDRLIQEKQNLLSELESYKKSVIYEYVTGKKEVPA